MQSSKKKRKPKNLILSEQTETAQQLGQKALTFAVGSFLATFFSYLLLSSFWLSLGIFCVGSSFTFLRAKEWLEYRGKWGMYF